MKALSIVSEQFHQEFNIQDYDIQYGNINMYGANLRVALLEVEDEQFEYDNQEFANSVLIKKKAFSLNFRDKSLSLETSAFMNIHGVLTHMPIGSEFSGIVEKVGRNVTDLKVGDRVISNAVYSFSDQVNVKPGIASNNSSKELEIIDANKLIQMPDSMSFEEGAGFTIGAQTAFSIINKLNLKGDESILITAGTSCTSQFIISALQGKAKHIIVLTLQSRYVTNLLNLGATEVIVVSDRNTLLKNDSLMSTFANLKGFDAVIDPFCDTYLHQLLYTLKDGGNYITCGLYNQSGQVKFTDRRDENWTITELMKTLIFRNLKILGNCLGSTADLVMALESYKKGQFRVPIDFVYQPNKFEEFCKHSFLEQNKFGKVIFRF